VILKEEADKTLSYSPPWCCWWCLFIISFKRYITLSSRLFRNKNETPV